MSENGLLKLSEATRLLAECRTVLEAKEIRDVAAAAETYAKMSKLGLEASNHATEIKLRAERRMGELLRGPGIAQHGDNKHTLRGSGGRHLVTRSELGIHRDVAAKAQRLAAIPADTFESHIAEVKASGEQLTRVGVLRIQDKPNEAIKVHYSSDTPEWYTPDIILGRVYEVLEVVDLDPCSEWSGNDEEEPNVRAEKHYTAAMDGLAQNWHGKVYMNPPYGNEVKDWVAKLIEEYEAGNVGSAIALLPARTDTAWFRQLRPYLRCFVWGRLRFSGADNSAPFPSMVVYLGVARKAFCEVFADIGDIYGYISHE